VIEFDDRASPEDKATRRHDGNATRTATRSVLR
jgi:hypothetical protein